MDRDRLLIVLAAVFAGLAVALSAVALAEQPFVLLLALPFGVTAYFMWHQATGRLERRTRARARKGGPTGGRRAAARGPRGGPWAEDDPGRAAGATGRGPPTHDPDPGPSPAEAYRILGLEPGADPAEVRAAYRERAKELHPDAESGDEEAFKRITRAYETLTD